MRYNDSVTEMERASTLIGKLKGPIETDDLARTAWPLAVGKKIALRTRPYRLVGARLVVEVEDLIWRKQLLTLSPQILRNLEKHLGPGMVDSLEFRVMPLRREAQRAITSQPALAFDEADAIADPVMRNVYRISRKKALA